MPGGRQPGRLLPTHDRCRRGIVDGVVDHQLVIGVIAGEGQRSLQLGDRHVLVEDEPGDRVNLSERHDLHAVGRIENSTVANHITHTSDCRDFPDSGTQNGRCVRADRKRAQGCARLDRGSDGRSVDDHNGTRGHHDLAECDLTGLRSSDVQLPSGDHGSGVGGVHVVDGDRRVGVIAQGHQVHLELNHVWAFNSLAEGPPERELPEQKNDGLLTGYIDDITSLESGTRRRRGRHGLNRRRGHHDVVAVLH